MTNWETVREQITKEHRKGKEIKSVKVVCGREHFSTYTPNVMSQSSMWVLEGYFYRKGFKVKSNGIKSVTLTRWGELVITLNEWGNSRHRIECERIFGYPLR